MNYKAAKTSAALALLFLIIYGSTNWVTLLRSNVRSFYFPWEHKIPFVAWMIIPYMSMDLFFIAAPFLCRTDRQRITLAARLMAAIFVAAICFLIMPMKFAFARPVADGPLASIFINLHLMDQPFNQFPSLHIAQLMILIPVYHQRFGRSARAIFFSWFVLIAASTLFIYQHHVIDIIGGGLLGTLCLYLFQDGGRDENATANYRVGTYYFCAALALAAMSAMLMPWGLVLFWPAVALALMGSAYFHFGSNIFRKREGKLPLFTRLIFAPLLFGQYLSLRHYASKSDRWNALTSRVWIGRKLSNQQATEAIANGVTAVLDLTGEFSEAKPFLSITYRQLPVLDLTAPTTAQQNEAIDFIKEEERRGIVYIHCKAGYSRSAAVAGAYLLATNRARSVDEAIEMLRASRPAIVIRPEIMKSLRSYAAEATGGTDLRRRSSIAQSAATVSTSVVT